MDKPVCHEIRYELTDAQIRRATRVFWWRTAGKNILLLSATALFWGLLALDEDTPVPSAIALTIAGYSTVLLVGSYSIARMRVRRHRAVLEDGTHVVRFSNDGVSVTTDVGSFTYKWRLFTGLWTAADLLLLVLVGRGWLALPRKAVSPELLEYIRTCLRVSRGRPRCNKCGYDLRGQTVPRCPECGTEFEPEKLEIR